MPGGPYRYRETILRELERYGLRPKPATPPGLLHDFLTGLYAFQIREIKLKQREVERFFGPQPLDAYADKIRALKRDHPLLSLPLEAWTEASGAD